MTSVIATLFLGLALLLALHCCTANISCESKCPRDSYCKINGFNFTCHTCDKCSGFHEHEESPCGPTHNRKCVCNHGYYRLPSGMICTPHTRCGKGYEIATQGTPLTDTTCKKCRSDEYSDDYSSCKKHTNCAALGMVEVHPGNLTHDTSCAHILTTPSPIATTTATSGSPDVVLYISLGVIGFLLVILLVVVVLLCLKRKGKLDSALRKVSSCFHREQPVNQSYGNAGIPLVVAVGDAPGSCEGASQSSPGVGSNNPPVVQNRSVSTASSQIDATRMVAVPHGQKRNGDVQNEIAQLSAENDAQTLTSDQSSIPHVGYRPPVVQNGSEPLSVSNGSVLAASNAVSGSIANRYTAKQKQLADQRVLFKNNLDASSVVDHLEQGGIITNDEKQRILRQVTDNDKAGKLIDIVLKRGDDAINVFRTALYKEKQTFLADKLALEKQNTETVV